MEVVIATVRLCWAHLSWQGHKQAASECAGGKNIYFIYILILPNTRFLTIRGAQVRSLFHLPPSRPCLVGGAVPEQVAEPCSKRLTQSRAAGPCGLEQDCLWPHSPRGVRIPQGGFCGAAHPDKGSGCPWWERGSCQRSCWFAKSLLLNMDMIIFNFLFACSGILCIFPLILEKNQQCPVCM